MTAPPQPGDILIVRDTSDQPSFVVLDAITTSRVCGPFPTLRETLQRASQLDRHGAIWHKNVDERGRELGPPMRLPIRLGMGRQ